MARQPMLELPARTVARRFDHYLDKATQRPVGIQFDGETRLVMIAVEEYERLRRRSAEP